MKNGRLALLFSLCGLLGAPALAQTISGGSCSPANLSGTYNLLLNGRIILPTGALTTSFQSIGTATFDGQSIVTLAGTYNSTQAAGQTFSYSGTYTLPSNCFGTITLTQGSSATFALVVWSSGSQFDITGIDPSTAASPNSSVYSGNGSNVAPTACGTATLSGTYTYDALGSTLSGTNQHDAAVESGFFQFDGQGNATASYTVTSSNPPTATPLTSMGTYTVGANCLGSAKLTDSTGTVNTLNFAIAGNYGQNLKLMEASSQFIRSGQGHAALTNPTQSIANVASYAVQRHSAGQRLYIVWSESRDQARGRDHHYSADDVAEYHGDDQRRAGSVVLCRHGPNRCADAVGYSRKHLGHRDRQERQLDQ